MTLLGFRGVSPVMLLFFPMALAAVFGGFLLLKRRGARISPRVRRAYLWAWSLTALAALCAFPIVRMHGKYLIMFWLTVLACFGASALGLLAAAYGPAGAASCPHAASRRRFLAGGVAAAAGTLVTFAGVDAATGQSLDVAERRIDLKRRPGSVPGRELRVSFISDLHAGFFLPQGYLSQATGIIEAFRPDVVLFGGDTVEYELSALDEVQGFFRHLAGIAPVYAVLGNHDGYIDPDAMAAFHRLNGVTPLRGEATELTGPWGRFTLLGLRDMTEERPDGRRLLAQDPDHTLLLVHNPQAVLNIPAHNAPLVCLCGHTHGGQMRIPGAGAMVNQADRRIVAGLNEIDGKRIAVTAGLGYSGLPVRLLCPPDVTNLVIA
ncbi:metallophosphoesterase [Fundidesulfovibrio terrae]|uniref:metallophosphoesterase n=1 Tax=Fundidesulfovibrio terrae TaxID=2922866 RepID=UPI001FAFCF4E|nr:metallophosphoesterase [Fundidesulfovibrio terrae]